MSAIMKDVAKAPKTVAKEVKTVVSQTLKPANKHDMLQIAIGSVAGGLLTPLYNKLADSLLKLIPSTNETLIAIIRSTLPFGLAYAIYKLRIPLGNIFAGGFLGVGIGSLMNWVLSFFGSKLGVSTKASADPEIVGDIEVASSGWGVQ